jgi:hypothetical protein
VVDISQVPKPMTDVVRSLSPNCRVSIEYSPC